MAGNQKSHYEVLEISPDANSDEVRQAYRQKSLAWHPDKNMDKPEEATKMMQEIVQAYNVLSDDAKRKSYDRKLNASSDSDEDDFMDGWRRQMEEALMKAYFESMFCSFHARGARQKVGRSSYTYASHRGYTGCGYAKGTANYERAKTEKAARPREEESRKSESVDSKSDNRKGSQKAFLRREKKRRQKIAKKFEHPKHESVYKMICECEGEEGVTCDEVWLCVSSKMSKSDVDDALNFLCNEGYIHKTKRDHFKATDSES